MKDNITVIPAIRRMGNSSSKEERPKLRVAAYCRVSTDSEEQAKIGAKSSRVKRLYSNLIDITFKVEVLSGYQYPNYSIEQSQLF